MIVPSWSGHTTATGGERSVAYFRNILLPKLQSLDGHRGAMLRTRGAREGEEVEVTVLTFWDSMASIRRFAGADPATAVVDPEAETLLARQCRSSSPKRGGTLGTTASILAPLATLLSAMSRTSVARLYAWRLNRGHYLSSNRGSGGLLVRLEGRVKLRAAILGLVAAVVAVPGIHLPFPAYSRLVLALFLSLTACVYLGALLAQAQRRGTWIAELAAAAAVFACSLLGMAASSAWLGLGYAVHGGWDWLHEAGGVPTRVAEWFPPLCAAFDFVVAVLVLGWLWHAA
jgi:hypothetical protein